MKITGRQRLPVYRCNGERSGGGHAQHPLHAENIQDEEFNPAEFNLGEERSAR